MTSIELDQHLSRLGLNQTEAAQLLGVAPRTVRRWFEGEDVPGPAEQALRAWLRLRQHNLPWRPDSLVIFENDQQQIGLYREDAVALSKMLSNVKARGKALLPWVIDLEKCRACLGGSAEIEVWFYRLPNGGFTLSSYSRGDKPAHIRRDLELIEEAAFCIAKELKKEATLPVTLIYYDRKPLGAMRAAAQHSEEFPSFEAAIQRACARMGSADFNDPFILESMSGNDRGLQHTWDTYDLRRECERRTRDAARRRTVMNDFIYDDQGKCLARINRNEVFSDTTGQKIATIRDGSIYTLEGDLVGHLQRAGLVRMDGDCTPPAFMKLLG